MLGVAWRARNGEGGTWQVVDAPGGCVVFGLVTEAYRGADGGAGIGTRWSVGRGEGLADDVTLV